MKRTYSEIESTAVAAGNNSRTFSPYDKNNLGADQKVIMTHSNAQPTNVTPLNPSQYDGPNMMKPVAINVETEPRITNPSRTYTDFSFVLGDQKVFIAAPRQYEFSFMYKSMPVQRPRTAAQSDTQRNWNTNTDVNEVPVYAVSPFNFNIVNGMWQQHFADSGPQGYAAYSELTADILYHGLPEYGQSLIKGQYVDWDDYDERAGGKDGPEIRLYMDVFAPMRSFFAHYKGLTCIDGVTMANEPYRGRDPLNPNMGNTIFHLTESINEAYHKVAQNMKGIYQMHNYWKHCGTFPNAALYFVIRKYAPERYRGWNPTERTISFCMTQPSKDGGSMTSYEQRVSVALRQPVKRFKEDYEEDVEETVVEEEGEGEGIPVPKEMPPPIEEEEEEEDRVPDAYDLVDAKDNLDKLQKERDRKIKNRELAQEAELKVGQEIVALQKKGTVDIDGFQVTKAGYEKDLQKATVDKDAKKVKDSEEGIEFITNQMKKRQEELEKELKEKRTAQKKVQDDLATQNDAIGNLENKVEDARERVYDIDEAMKNKTMMLLPKIKAAAAAPAPLRVPLPTARKVLKTKIIPQHKDAHNVILPLLMCAVAIPDNGHLPREYLRYTDEDGRERYGKHIFVGTLMRPSYFKDVQKPLKPDELEPLMDMRMAGISSKDVIHVRVDPDDSYHTVL